MNAPLEPEPDAVNENDNERSSTSKLVMRITGVHLSVGYSPIFIHNVISNNPLKLANIASCVASVAYDSFFKENACVYSPIEYPVNLVGAASSPNVAKLKTRSNLLLLPEDARPPKLTSSKVSDWVMLVKNSLLTLNVFRMTDEYRVPNKPPTLEEI